MKNALLLALAGLLSAIAPAALAHPPAANVNFSSERGVPFGLVLDGRPLTRGMARQVHVDRLAPGLHWADFTVPTAYGRAIRFRSRVWLEPGLETTFVLLARPGRPLDLRQVGAVALYGRGNGYGNGYYNSPRNGPRGYGSPYDGYGNGAAANSAPNQGYDPNYGGDGYDPNDGGHDDAPDGAGYYPGSAASSYRLMQSQEVTSLIQVVQQRPSEASKLSIAKEALTQSSIQTEDLKRLLRSLDFEASRVDLAKFAYVHVADRQNWYRVYQAFDYDASTQEVQRAIGSAPR